LRLSIEEKIIIKTKKIRKIKIIFTLRFFKRLRKLDMIEKEGIQKKIPTETNLSSDFNHHHRSKDHASICRINNHFKNANEMRALVIKA
jgi:hypothetical protein